MAPDIASGYFAYLPDKNPAVELSVELHECHKIGLAPSYL